MPSELQVARTISPGPATALASAGVRPRKSRGQNFLVQQAVARRIVEAASLVGGESVIEIGPGLGILTDLIATRPLTELTLIELDRQLATTLATRFHADPRVSIIEQDFLRVDLAAARCGKRDQARGNRQSAI